MSAFSGYRLNVSIALFALAMFVSGCAVSSSARYYGKTIAPDEDVLRYVSGYEPGSLDPAVPNGQAEARILIALYEGLVEYHPKTMEPIPAIAEKWQISPDGTEYTFQLRKNAAFSNGDAISADDVVYSIRRALSPELASVSASLGYYIQNAEAYNAQHAFVLDTNGKYLLKTENETEFLTVPAEEKARNKFLESRPEIADRIKGGTFVPVTAKDVGVQAVGDHTLKIKLSQPAHYFLGMLAHHFFRVVPRAVIEKHSSKWTQSENIVTSGAFKLKDHEPYHLLSVERNPHYWDAKNVKLDRIDFYPLEQQTTMMNLYKTGEVDALYNHTVPSSWNEHIKNFKDEYLLHPEAAIEFYVFNTKKPPFDNVKVRQAFSLAIDRKALANYRKTVKPLTDITPADIFPSYETAKAKIIDNELKEIGISREEWDKRLFDPVKARRLLAEAGFPVTGEDRNFSCEDFPVSEVSLSYNADGNNKANAEFIQAQWKQNLGISVPLESMEWRAFVQKKKKLEYNGIARGSWGADFMDPFTFLSIFYSTLDQSNTGWHAPAFDKLLDEANRTVNVDRRAEMLARAEMMIVKQQLVIPLTTQGTSWMKKPFVKGMYPNAGTLHPWKFVYIERDVSKWDRDVDNIMAN